jgi:hypothetical protein
MTRNGPIHGERSLLLCPILDDESSLYTRSPFLVIGSRPPLYRIQDKKKEYVVHHDRLKRCHDRHIPLWLRRLLHDLFNTPMPDLEQSGIDPDETLPYCDGFPLLGPSR